MGRCICPSCHVLVELMDETHFAQVIWEKAFLIVGVIVGNASEEGGNAFGVHWLENGLQECKAARPVIVINSLFRVEVIVQSECGSKLKNILVLPDQDEDG